MIDAAFFPYDTSSIGESRCVSLHAHAIVWGTTKRKLKKWRGRRYPNMVQSPVAYVRARDFRRVQVGDLRQVLWYVFKTPYKQYQLEPRQNGRHKCHKRQINGVNSVKLLLFLMDHQLQDMILVGKGGLKFLEVIPKRNARMDPKSRRRDLFGYWGPWRPAATTGAGFMLGRQASIGQVEQPPPSVSNMSAN
jgi:hypothetical protein